MLPGQLSLLDWEPPRFDGATYDHERDHGRLNAQLRDVRNLMSDKQWRTLSEIAEQTGHPLQSVSARLRDLRKSKFGGLTVEREYISRGLYRYRVASC